MQADEIDRAVKVAAGLAKWAVCMMRRPPGEIRVKAHAADLVTRTDTAIESRVREVLNDAFPEHSVVGEEFGVQEGRPDAPTWVIDPIDGTTNFARGIGWSSFSLGLRDTAGSVIAVVADPWRGETFTAVRGAGAQLNGVRIEAADHRTLSGQVVMTEWAAHAPWPGMYGMLSELSRRSCTVRIMGSTALSLVQVAAGRAVATVVGEFHCIDALPATLIGTEAGAITLDDQGERTATPVGGLLLAAPGVAAEALQVWQDALAADTCTLPPR